MADDSDFARRNEESIKRREEEAAHIEFENLEERQKRRFESDQAQNEAAESYVSLSAAR